MYYIHFWVLLNDVGMDTFWTHSCSKCPKCVQGSVQTKLFGHILAQSVQFMSKMCPTELLVSKLQVYLDIFWTLCANICPIQKLWCPKCVQKVGHIIDIKRTKSSLPKMCPNLGYILNTKNMSKLFLEMLLLSQCIAGEHDRALHALQVPQHSPLSHSWTVTNQSSHPIIGGTYTHTPPQATSHSGVNLGPIAGRVQMHRQWLSSASHTLGLQGM